jgi:hypothetical protein
MHRRRALICQSILCHDFFFFGIGPAWPFCRGSLCPSLAYTYMLLLLPWPPAWVRIRIQRMQIDENAGRPGTYVLALSSLPPVGNGSSQVQRYIHLSKVFEDERPPWSARLGSGQVSVPVPLSFVFLLLLARIPRWHHQVMG